MEKIKPEVSGLKSFFFSGAEVASSLKHVLDEMEEFNVSDWPTKKGLQKLSSKEF